MDAKSSEQMMHEEHGVEGESCRYEDCKNESTTLVQFDETKPVQRYWFCAPHAGNSIKKHDDAHKVEVA